MQPELLHPSPTSIILHILLPELNHNSLPPSMHLPIFIKPNPKFPLLPLGNIECLGPTSTPSSFIFQAYVLCQTTGLSTVWLQEQCFHQYTSLQPGQGAGEVLQDQLRLQRLRRQQQPPSVRETGHRTQSSRTKGHLTQRIRRYYFTARLVVVSTLMTNLILLYITVV